MAGAVAGKRAGRAIGAKSQRTLVARCLLTSERMMRIAGSAAVAAVVVMCSLAYADDGGAARDDVVVGGVLGGPDSGVLRRGPARPGRKAERACKRGRVSACVDLARWTERQGRDATRYHERACRAGNTSSCVFAGDGYRKGSHATRRNRKRARELFRRGCDGQDVFSCFGLAHSYAEEKTPAGLSMAIALMTHGCRVRYLPGCEEIGVPMPPDWMPEMPTAQAEAFRASMRRVRETMAQ